MNQQTEQLNELALFAGAGGGILGGHLLGWRTVCAVEFAAYPRSVLLARQRDGMLPKFPVWDDVRTFDGTAWRGHVDVISGGFPCQDISVAGKGDGLDGERSGLWSEMARIIGEVQPSFAFVENSPMLTSRGLDRVLGDLSTLGYDAEWGVVGADDAGAPHRRERIWIVAYSNFPRLQEQQLFDADLPIGSGNAAPKEVGSFPYTKSTGAGPDNGGLWQGLGGIGGGEESTQSQHPIGQLADPDLCGRLHGQAEERTAIGGIHAQREPEPSGEDVSNTNGHGLQRGIHEGEHGEQRRDRPSWPVEECGAHGQPGIQGGGWWSVEPGVGLLVDRLAAGMGPHGPVEPGSVPRVATGVPKRADRLKAIGNGQVPAAAALAWNTLYARIQQRS